MVKFLQYFFGNTCIKLILAKIDPTIGIIFLFHFQLSTVLLGACWETVHDCHMLVWVFWHQNRGSKKQNKKELGIKELLIK